MVSPSNPPKDESSTEDSSLGDWDCINNCICKGEPYDGDQIMCPNIAQLALAMANCLEDDDESIDYNL